MKLNQQKYKSNADLLRKSRENDQRSSLKIQESRKHSINKNIYDPNIGPEFDKIKNEQVQTDIIKEKQEQPANNSTQIFYFSNKIRKIVIQKLDENKKQNFPIITTRIIANGKISAAFDNKSNLWLFGVIFPEPINLSNVIKKKIIDGFLGEKGIIIKTSNKFFVINWDKIDLPKQILRKNEINRKYSNYFQCWQEIVPYRNDAWFMLSSKKQCVCETVMYHIFSEKLIIYPFAQQISLGYKIKGISASKTHTLCWTECGKLFSWGQRSLALGYTDFDHKFKQRQISSVKFEVVSAVAGTHYSIALSSEGDLYEWGIKNTWNEMNHHFNEEFIFVPRKLQIKINNEPIKICCLKGFEDHFGILTFKNQLFLWGKTISKKLMQFSGYFEQDLSIQPSSQNNMEMKLSLSTPTLCKCSKVVKIVDFQIRQDYVFLVTAPLQSKLKNHLAEKFWQRRLKNISNIVKNCKFKRKDDKKSTSICPQQEIIVKQKIIKPQNEQINTNIIHQRYQSAFQFEQMNFQDKCEKMQNLANKLNKKRFFCEDRITKAVNERLTKQQYFRKLKNQQKIYQEIMVEVPKNNFLSIQRNSKVSTEHYMAPKNSSVDFIKFQRKSKIQTCDVRYSQKDDENHPRTTLRNKIIKYKSVQNLLHLKIDPLQALRAEILLKNSPLQLEKRKRNNLYEKIKKRKANQYYSAKNSRQISPTSRSTSQLYNQKLNSVLSRKQSLNENFFQSTLSKMQRCSVQFKKKQVEQLTARKIQRQNKQMLKQTLVKYLIQNYLIKLFTDPIIYGRETKIKLFVSNLKYNRVQKSVRRLFCTKRIKFDVQTLKQHMPKNLLKLIIIYRNFVKKWRQSKRKRINKFCVEQMIKVQSRNKIRIGLKHLKINVKNLENIGSWLKISKHQKIKCLNQIWKKQLLTIFPVKKQFQSQYNVKNDPVKSFKQLYLQRLNKNPMLKIQNYLGVSPLFKVKILRNCSQKYMEMIMKNKEILQIQFLKHNPMHKNLKRKKKQEKPQKIIKKNQLQEQKFDLRYCVLNQNQYLLPYSKHSIIFQKPTNFELNISLRNQQKWALEQKGLLIELLQKFIRKFHLQYEQKTFKYRRQMAVFIRDNYSKISQRRSRYILEYNQLQVKRNQRQVRIKDRQLRKCLNCIGCEGILSDDILPQKHRILDEAKEMVGAPQPPSVWIAFGMGEFKKVFRQYFDQLQDKIKTKKVK